MDLSVEAGALGLEVRFSDSDSPTVVEHPVHSLADLDRFNGRSVLADARARGFVATVQQMAAEFDTLVGAYAIGPFSLAGLLMSASQATIATIEDPELLHAVLRMATAMVLPYIHALEDAGADMIAILEPTGSLLSPRSFDLFCGQYVREIVASMRTPSILHICGQTNHLLDRLVATGAQGLSLDSAVDLPDAARRVPKDVVLIGNLDTVRVMCEQSPAEVYASTAALLEGMAPFDNFILSSACDLPLQTPLENIEAMIQAAHDLAC